MNNRYRSAIEALLTIAEASPRLVSQVVAMGDREAVEFLADLVLSVDQLDDLRYWIADCAWRDIDGDDLADIRVADLVSGVHAHYLGGLAEFIADGDYASDGSR